MTRMVSLVLVVAACGGAVAERPLTVRLGISREQAIRELRSHAFCPSEDGPAQKLEVYPRCERAGSEWGEAWVAARYEGDTLVELRRFERYADDAVAVQRWNQLVAARARLSPEAPGPRGTLVPGTRSVKVFQLDPSTIAVVYLLTPTPPEQASVLEAIVVSEQPSEPSNEPK